MKHINKFSKTECTVREKTNHRPDSNLSENFLTFLPFKCNCCDCSNSSHDTQSKPLVNFFHIITDIDYFFDISRYIETIAF